MHRSDQKENRGGYTLIFFVFFIVLSFAIGALVVDMGFVNLARRQMQTHTDAAALEIQRNLGEIAVDPNPFEQPFFLQLRQEAGPLLFNEGGVELVGGFRAQPLMTGTGKWVPELQPPQGDTTDDVVFGNYRGHDQPHVEIEIDSIEEEYYDRGDFEINADDSSISANPDVLVRLRRTGESFESGGASSGPTVPFIFGRGMLTAANADFWERIERGTHVRQTSIATRAPALIMGPLNEEYGLPGLYNVQIDDDLFYGQDSAPLDDLSQGDEEEVPDGTRVQLGESRPAAVGQLAFLRTQSVLNGSEDFGGFVILTREFPNSDGELERRVVGFGHVSTISVSIEEETVNWTRLPINPTDVVANVSSTIPRQFNNFSSETALEAFRRNLELWNHTEIDGDVEVHVPQTAGAPALVRSIR